MFAGVLVEYEVDCRDVGDEDVLETDGHLHIRVGVHVEGQPDIGTALRGSDLALREGTVAVQLEGLVEVDIGIGVERRDIDLVALGKVEDPVVGAIRQAAFRRVQIHELVAASAASQVVEISTAIDLVIASAAVDVVKAGAAEERVVALVAGHGVVEFVACAGDIVGAAQGQIFEVAAQGKGGQGRDDRVSACTSILSDHVADALDIVSIVALAADHRVGALFAVEDVVTTEGGDNVLVVVAVHDVGNFIASAVG